MSSAVTGYDSFKIWLGVVVVGVMSVLIGILVFPRRIYEGFLWRYFLGPVIADARGAPCAVRRGGQTDLLTSTSACEQATGIVAYPGYTTVSTVSYAFVLVVALVGVLYLLRYLDVGESSSFFFAFVPFMLFGGALRVLEDANVALLRDGATPVLPFPWTMLIISPFIYFTVFAIALVALVAAVIAARNGYLARYERAVAICGSIAFVLVVGYLVWLSVTTSTLDFTLAVPVITLGGATIITWLVWVMTERYYPEVNAGTSLMGPVVVWGHTIDGIANVLSLDWAATFGLPAYAPKHVVNRGIIEVTSRIQPEAVSDVIGTAWPFLFVKVGVAVLVVWLFDERMFQDNPRYVIVLFIAILAVGIGPGTRDFLRATFGI